MNDVLIHTIIEHTKVMFYNFSITLKTCDMDTILCDMPIWKHVYHTLHSLDQWYINPEVYTEPDFHEPNLNSLDDNGSRFLSCLVYPESGCFTGFLGHQSFCLVL